jgi:hypothetical protein
MRQRHSMLFGGAVHCSNVGNARSGGFDRWNTGRPSSGAVVSTNMQVTPLADGDTLRIALDDVAEQARAFIERDKSDDVGAAVRKSYERARALRAPFFLWASSFDPANRTPLLLTRAT